MSEASLLGLGLDEEQRGVARGPAVHVEELVRLLLRDAAERWPRCSREIAETVLCLKSSRRLEDTHVFRLRRADDVPPHLKRGGLAGEARGVLLRSSRG